MTGECINIFHQGKNKSNMSKISITLDNNAFFLVEVLVIFRVFMRKQRDHLKLSYLAIFLIVILLLKFKIEDGFPFSFTSLQKCSTVFQLRNYNIASLCSTYNIASIFSLAITNLKFKDYTIFISSFCYFQEM